MMVESRCAITMVVRPLRNSASASCTCRSDSEIERRGGLVEQNDRRVLDQRAGNGDALALAAGKLQAVLADGRFVPEREAYDEIVRVRGLGSGDDLGFAGANAAEPDVFADAAAEELNHLPDIGNLLAERAARHRSRCPARR